MSLIGTLKRTHDQRVEQTAGGLFIGMMQCFFAQSAFFGGKGDQIPVVAFDSQNLSDLMADFTSSASVLSCNGDDGVHRSTPLFFEMYIIIQTKWKFVNTFAQVFADFFHKSITFVRKETL